jgi:20S proteasome alpha/beta subunit
MTLLVTLKGKDSLVLAADSRGTFGDPRGVTAQNDSQQKAHILSPHAAVLTAGAGELGGLVITTALERLKQQPQLESVTPVMGALRDVSRQLYQEWFSSLPAVAGPKQQAGQEAGRPDVSFIVAGYDLSGTGNFDVPNIYQLVSALDFPPMLHSYGFAVAGIPMYALYLLNRLYEADRSVDEITALAVYTITETASQDGKVGGPVRVITITPSAGCVELDQGAVDTVIQSNAQRAQALRSSFYGESK